MDLRYVRMKFKLNVNFLKFNIALTYIENYQHQNICTPPPLRVRSIDRIPE